MIRIKSNTRGVAIAIDKSLKAKIRGIEKGIDNWLAVTKNEIVNNAGNIDSPEKDKLSSAIVHDRRKNMVYVDNTKAPYAPFIEFGTKTKYKAMRRELGIVAARYRGIPMDFDELVQRIEKTTGASNEKARGIARKYGTKGTTPRPFFYNAVYGNYPTLKRTLKQALKKRR